jgi:hypothetical protein
LHDSHGSHGARKATFILVEQRRSMQGVRSQWRVGRKRCCTRSRSESHSRKPAKGEALGNYLLQAARRRRSPAPPRGPRVAIDVEGPRVPNLDRHPPQPCTLPNSQPLFAFGRKARGSGNLGDPNPPVAGRIPDNLPCFDRPPHPIHSRALAWFFYICKKHLCSSALH